MGKVCKFFVSIDQAYTEFTCFSMFVPKNSSIFAQNQTFQAIIIKCWQTFFLFPYSPLRYTAVAILHLLLQLRWRQWEHCHMGCSDLANIGTNLVPMSLLVLLMVRLWILDMLQQHSNFQVIQLLQSLPIKVAPLSIWQRNPNRKRLHLFQAINAVTVFF